MSCPQPSISSLWAERDVVTIIILVASNAGSFLLGALLVFLIVKLRHRHRRRGQNATTNTTRNPSNGSVVQLEQGFSKSGHVHVDKEDRKVQELVIPEQDETLGSSPRSLSHTFVRHSIKPPMNMFNTPEGGDGARPFKLWTSKSSTANFRSLDAYPLVASGGGIGNRKISEESGRGTTVTTSEMRHSMETSIASERLKLDPLAAVNSYRDQFGKREHSTTISAFMEKDRGSVSSCSRDGSFQEPQLVTVKREGSGGKAVRVVTSSEKNEDEEEEEKKRKSLCPSSLSSSSPTDLVMGIVSTPTTGNHPEMEAALPTNWTSQPVKPRPMSTKYEGVGVQRTKSAPRSITTSTATMTAGYGFGLPSSPPPPMSGVGGALRSASEFRRSRTLSSPQKSPPAEGVTYPTVRPLPVPCTTTTNGRHNSIVPPQISPSITTPRSSISTPLAPISASAAPLHGFPSFRSTIAPSNMNNSSSSPGLRTFANIPQPLVLPTGSHNSNLHPHLIAGTTNHSVDSLQSPPLTSLTNAFQSTTDGGSMSPRSPPDPTHSQTQVAYVHLPGAQHPEHRMSFLGGINGGRENGAMLALDDTGHHNSNNNNVLGDEDDDNDRFGAGRASVIEISVDEAPTPSEPNASVSSLSRQLSNHAAVSFYQEHAKRHISMPYGIAQSSPVLPDSPSGVIGAESPGVGSASSRPGGDFSFARGKPSRLR